MRNRLIFIFVFITYSLGVFALALTTKNVLWGMVMAVVAGILSWIISSAFVDELRQFSYEMEQIARGNNDVEIMMATDVDLKPLVTHLETIRHRIKTMETYYAKKTESQTKELTRKIADLEKLQDITTDSVLLAKRMQQERDQFLIQMQQLSHPSKKHDHKD